MGKLYLAVYRVYATRMPVSRVDETSRLLWRFHQPTHLSVKDTPVIVNHDINL